jgi:hypothetical protein
MTLFQRTILENLGISDVVSNDIVQAETVIEEFLLNEYVSPHKKYVIAKDNIFFDELAETPVKFLDMPEVIVLTESIMISGPTYINLSDILVINETIEKNAHKENIEDILIITETLESAEPISVSVIEYFTTRETSESTDSSTVPELIGISEEVLLKLTVNLTVSDFFEVFEVAAKAEFINLIDVWVITDIAESSKWEEPFDKIYFAETLTHYFGKSAIDNLDLSEIVNPVSIGVLANSENLSLSEAVTCYVA